MIPVVFTDIDGDQVAIDAESILSIEVDKEQLLITCDAGEEYLVKEPFLSAVAKVKEAMREARRP